MEENNHQPAYIPQIGVPEKHTPQNSRYISGIHYKATAPGFFGVIILCFFLSFINLKCNGNLIKSYSGIQIIQGNNELLMAKELTVVLTSAQFTFEKAKSKALNNKTSSIEKEDDSIETDDPYIGNLEDPWKESITYSTKDPTQTRLFTFMAFLCACFGLCSFFFKGKKAAIIQTCMGALGFIFLFSLQYWIKISIPDQNGEQSLLSNGYTTPAIVTEFAMGYWIALFLFLGVSVVGILKFKYLRKVNSTS